MVKVPYGNLPALWIDHNIYGEPSVITRHIARSLGMLGTTEAETFVVEAVLEQVRESPVKIQVLLKALKGLILYGGSYSKNIKKKKKQRKNVS